MELLPMVKYEVSKTFEKDLMLAELYEAAGMDGHAGDIRKKEK